MDSPWVLDATAARLRLGPLAASLDPARPGDGLDRWSLAGAGIAPIHVLGIEIPRPTAGGPPLDRYVRGADLAVAFRESADWPIRLDALWRAERAPPVGALAVLDLVLSVRTERLDSRPALVVRSLLPAGNSLPELCRERPPWRNAGAEQDADTRVPERRAPRSLQEMAGSRSSADHPDCPWVLIRLPEVEVSYAEMVHPADRASTHVAAVPGQPHCVQLSHHLFPEPLEKGVILRSRVRGEFLDRENDAALAAECYAAFAAAEPPLGT